MDTRLAGESKKQLCTANVHQPGRDGEVIAKLCGPAEAPVYSDGQMGLIEGDLTEIRSFCACRHVCVCTVTI